MLLSRCQLFRQTKFSVPSEFFPVAHFPDVAVSTPCRSSKFTLSGPLQWSIMSSNLSPLSSFAVKNVAYKSCHTSAFSSNQKYHALCQLHVFTSSFNLLTRLSMSFVTGQSFTLVLVYNTQLKKLYY